MKKKFCLILASLMAITVSALDLSLDLSLGLGFSTASVDDNKTGYNCKYYLMPGIWDLNIMDNNSSVGATLRFGPSSPSQCVKKINGEKIFFTHVQDKDESLILNMFFSTTVFYGIELGDYLRLNIGAGISFSSFYNSTGKNAELISKDCLYGMGANIDINLKYNYKHFIACAGLETTLFPSAKYLSVMTNTNEIENNAFAYALRPYITLGYRFRIINLK